MTARPFQVDLAGLVELLSEHLYSSPRVFLRELLQNATDAITARQALDPTHVGTITFTVRAATGQSPPSLTIDDDGIGLTLDEATTLLATIGASSKRGDELGSLRESFIGQFGIGLLSCFMVSEEIRVTTRSARSGPDDAVEWIGRADGTFEVHPTNDHGEIGTRVILLARPDTSTWFDFDVVTEVVKEYGELLPARVVVRAGTDQRTVTMGEPPWRWTLDAETRHDAWLAYGSDVLGLQVLDVFPVAAPSGGVEGLAFVHATASHATARQAHRVYVKRMLLSDDADGLLPDWAFFVSCVVNAESVRPTASREAMHDDATLASVREQLGMSIRGYLLSLAITDAGRLESIVRRHELAMKRLACDDDEFLSIVADWLPFETTDGRMSLGSFRHRHPVVRYTATVDTFRQIAQVASAQGIGVVNGGFTHDAEVLSRIGDLVPGLDTTLVDARDLLEAFDESHGDDGPTFDAFEALAAQALEEFDCDVEVRHFHPVTLPTLYTSGDDARYRRTLDETKAAAAPLFGSILETLRPVDIVRPVLCFNAANPLVTRLAVLDDADAVGAAVEVLYVQALPLGRHPLRADEIAVLNTSLLGLIDRAVGAPPEEWAP